jgi:hypothetical protein
MKTRRPYATLAKSSISILSSLMAVFIFSSSKLLKNSLTEIKV